MKPFFFPLNSGLVFVLSTSTVFAQPSPITLEELQVSDPETIAQTGQVISQKTIVPITDIRLNPIASELEIILETLDGASLLIDAAQFRTEGISLVADIENAELYLPNAQELSVDNPTADIANVQVVQVEADKIRIIVTGKDSLPTTEVVLRSGIFSYVLAPGESSTEEELVITGIGEDEEGYKASNSGTATGTDTPIIETPFAIQTISQDVLRDQGSRSLSEALLNVSGVGIQPSFSVRDAGISIRGFNEAPILRDGFKRYGSFEADAELSNLEQIEVIKGAASILYGEIQPGGIVNLVSKRALSEPFYEGEVEFGSRALFSPRLDLSGPLTDSKNLRYRINTLFSTRDSFEDFDTAYRRWSVAPTLEWDINDRTDLSLSLEYLDDKSPSSFGLPVIDRSVVDVPFDRHIAEPNDFIEKQFLSLGYNFEHRFNENWKIRNGFRYSAYDYTFDDILLPLGFNESTGIINRAIAYQDGHNENFSFLTNVLGEFTTGSIKHTSLIGVDLNHSKDRIFSAGFFTGPFYPLDIFNPNYGQVPNFSTADLPLFGGSDITTNRLGIYAQDQLSLLGDNLKLMAGIRYDVVEQTNESIPGAFTAPGETTQTPDAFTPRLGLLYKIRDNLSVYGSYSQSFNPGTATTVSGELIEPERGQGFEVGFKTELLEDKVLATIAYFDVTKQNVAVTDPNNPLFSVATGEQQSRGVEFDISGEILPGWNIIASYAYTNAEITADSDATLIGNQLPGIAKHGASLWSTYEIQRGEFQGLGFGLGFNFVGERAGDLDNSYEADSYITTNAALFYNRSNWRFGLNLQNIGNVKYVESVGGRTSSNTYGEPFNLSSSVTYRF